MYEVIVLGATFAAAGIAQRYGKKCLILEQKETAGYEFFGALCYGSGYEKAPSRKESAALQKSLLEGGLYGGDRNIYPCLKAAQVRFRTTLVSVHKKDGFFLCETHGIDGFVTFDAKKVVDTRTGDAICDSKTYNLLMESPEVPSFPGVLTEKGYAENHYILRCPVPLDCSYPQAHQAARRIIAAFGDGQRLIYSADVFDYQVKNGYPGEETGILLLPSKSYENPVLAFEAGLEAAI